MQNNIIDVNNAITRKDYRYGVYKHRLITKDGVVYSVPFIVLKNKFNVIVHFTNFHKFVGIYGNKIFAPITSNNEAKLYYICLMLNYILIERYSFFKINHVFNITRHSLECFFRDYAQTKLRNGEYRCEQAVEKCVKTVIEFFCNLRKTYGDYVSLKNEDLYKEVNSVDRRGKLEIRQVPSFRVQGLTKSTKIFREIPTKVFVILLNLAFRYAPDIAFAICLQAFAGLRASEAMNVRQEISPLGAGIVFTEIEGRVIKAEIDLTQELPLRSDGVICGKIKRERKQCVYPPFLNAFSIAYKKHKEFLAGRCFEKEYCPMFINNLGKALPYAQYRMRFIALIENHLRPALLASEDAECRIYGQLLYENNLGLHVFRHWYSVQLVLHGEDIAQVQYWRGDKSPESALLYLQNKGELLRELKETSDKLSDMLIKQGEIITNETRQ